MCKSQRGVWWWCINHLVRGIQIKSYLSYLLQTVQVYQSFFTATAEICVHSFYFIAAFVSPSIIYSYVVTKIMQSFNATQHLIFYSFSYDARDNVLRAHSAHLHVIGIKQMIRLQMIKRALWCYYCSLCFNNCIAMIE